MAMLAGAAASWLIPALIGGAVAVGGATLLTRALRPKTQPLPPPAAPPRLPIRMSETASRQRASLLTRMTGGGAGIAPAAVGAGGSTPGPTTRPTLLGR